MSAENENITKGGITVEAEHIFPVIKRWLYSEKEIFLREIVSNACDAVTKLRRLSSLGEVSIIHGNGTGVLRAGIQDCLRRHPCVSSFRLGRYGEGETGVTIVSLK